MTRALVLGGGGPVGIGWQAGLLSGLAEAGVDVRGADLVVGTSAGSVVGAQLTTGRGLADVVGPVLARPTPVGQAQQDLASLIATTDGTGITEDEFVARFASLQDTPWPAAFRCTAVNVESGQFVVWDRAAGVDLQRAVASSCAIPVLTSTVTIAGETYMDGGARDMLNADLAADHERVLALSCVVLEPDDRVPPMLAERLPEVRTRIDELRARSTVEVVEPGVEAQELSGWGAYLMDHTRTGTAFDAGVRQAAVEAPRIAAFWS